MAEAPPRSGGAPRWLLEEDERALLQTLALVRRIVASRAYRIPRDEHPDLVQEAMLQLWRVLSGGTGEAVESLDGFAATIAHRCCLAWIRRGRRRIELPPDIPDPAPSAEDDLLRQERGALGLRVIRALPERCREILRLHVFQKLTYREIAARLERSEHGLRTQMVECLRQARTILDRLRREGGPAPLSDRTG